MSDNENDWGNKKQEYYTMNKTDKNDSDYIEEEKEAIRLQKKRLEKLKASNLIESSDDEKEDHDEDINASSKKQKETDVPIVKVFPKEEIIKSLQTIHELIEESEEDIKDTIEILQDEGLDIPITLDYLNWKKDTNILYALLLAYTSYAKINNKMNNHHPSIKKLEMVKYLISSSKKSNDIIAEKTDSILELINSKKIKNKHAKNAESSKMLQKKTQRKESPDEDYDDFIKRNVANVAKMKEDNKNKETQAKKRIAKEVESKNQFGIRKANKEVLKARGIYRKRKQYLGNAKVANREKFYKKEKQRKKMVKEYEGKPDVYGGEATGIRKDIIRSTMIKS